MSGSPAANDHETMAGPMSLSSLIVQRGVATIREVEEALARQVLYGGDLATNLMEVSRVDEAALVELLAQSYGMTAAPPGELARAPEDARALVPGDFAAKKSLVPLGVDAFGVLFAVSEPLSAEVEEELAYSLARPIAQRIAPLFRILQAVERDYGIGLDRRYQRLLARLGGERVNRSISPSQAPPLASLAPERKAPTPPPQKPPSHPSRQPSRTDRPEEITTERPELQRVASGAVRSEEPAMDVVRAGSQPSVQPIIGHMHDLVGSRAPEIKPLLLETAKPVDRSLPPAAPQDMSRGGLVRRVAVAHTRSTQRRRGPLTIDVAEDELEAAKDRDTILDLMFEYSRQFFDYTAIFILQSDIAEGRDAWGAGASRDDVVGIGVPLDFPSLLATVKKKPLPMYEKPSSEGIDAVLFADLKRPTGHPVFVVPIVVKTRVVAALIGDGGSAGVDIESQHDVSAFVALCGRAFERLIVRRKRAATEHPGTVPPASEASAAVAAAEQELSNTMRPNRSIQGLSAEAATAIGSVPPPAPRVALETSVPQGSEAPPSPPSSGPTSAPASSSKSRQPPPSTRLSVAPHAPPASARPDAVKLPSVIVAMPGEYEELLDRVLTQHDLDAEAAIVRAGQHAMGVVMSRFPGPTKLDSAKLFEGKPPKVTECGAILRVIARQRRVALPFVLPYTRDLDPDKRFWATFLLTELAYPEAVDAIVPRLFDSEPRVRIVARAAARAVAEVAIHPMVDRLEYVAKEANESVRNRVSAIDALGVIRDPSVVATLISLLPDSKTEVGEAAHIALSVATRQDFGTSIEEWTTWWNQNRERSRVEWLIDAITHDAPELHRAAFEELVPLSRDTFGFKEGQTKKDREQVQRRFAEWWAADGRVRHASRRA